MAQERTFDTSCISIFIGLLTGEALQWATTVWEGNDGELGSYKHFLTKFRRVFNHTSEGKKVSERILAMQQGNLLLQH